MTLRRNSDVSSGQSHVMDQRAAHEAYFYEKPGWAGGLVRETAGGAPAAKISPLP
jgi:hypothetical protein